jgi:ribosomal-protein-alanine N-acetyltransferase
MTLDPIPVWCELTTERFTLVRPRVEHVSTLLEIFGDEETMRYLQSPPARSREDCLRMLEVWYQECANGKGFRWVVLPKEAPEVPAGFFALHYISRQNRRAELGSYLHRRWWGRGLSLEVTREVLRFAFEDLDLHRVELRCDPRNEASMTIARKLSLRCEGVLRDYVQVEGKGFVDEAVHALLRSEYLGDQRR